MPELCLVGAYLFGGLSGGLPSALQAHGYKIKPEFLNALPYMMTVVVLVLVSTGLGAAADRRAGGARHCRTSARSADGGRHARRASTRRCG